MSLARHLMPRLVEAFASGGLRDLRRLVAETRRRALGRPHRVLYFHEVADPYSHLAAQVLGRFIARYDIELDCRLVGPAESVPEPGMLAAYARKDAADVAPPYGLAFPPGAAAPDPDLVRRANRLLAGLDAETFVRRAPVVGTAVWAGDRGALERLAQERPGVSEEQSRAAVAAGSALRKRLGHYSGAMFHYAGEWYWGVDRLGYLEERLGGLGLAREPVPAPLVVRPDLAPPPGSLARDPLASGGSSPALALEFFVSLRSPYTYIAMERVLDLPRRFGIELRLRPVLPMVMRGMEVPAAKRMYITLDTKREAERVGVAFGRVCDPVGEPVERGFSLYRFARDRGRAAEYLHSFARGAFAEGIDAGTDAGLRRIVENAGLSWEEARAHRDDERWRDELEENRRAMFDAGLWGVPSFRLMSADGGPSFATWGQDRIWLIEREILRRRAGADVAPPKPSRGPEAVNRDGREER